VQNELPQSEIVLLGVGHTNAHVLNMWRMHPLPSTRLTCVSNFGKATYSGMLPGTLAGQYRLAEMQIDLVRLCAAAGARLIQANVTGLDLQQQTLLFEERPPLPFDALSIGVGSRPAKVPGESEAVLPIKPMQSFLQRLEQRLDVLVQLRRDKPWRIAVAGGGAGGFEIACCLPRHIRQRYGDVNLEFTLVDRGAEVLKAMPKHTRALAQQELKRQGIRLALGNEITQVHREGRLSFADGGSIEADLILWATSARAPKILDPFDLPKDERGFLLTRSTLQSTAADSIFAVGDTGTLEQCPLAKAGVYAVRQGPVLWQNLRRKIVSQPLLEWRPQKSFLTLLNTGDDRAILTYKGWSIHARWCWKLKDTIDRRFMGKYRDYRPQMRQPVVPGKLQKRKMYCGGCGSKLPAGILSQVLSNLKNPASARIAVGLQQLEDVAVIKQVSSQQTAVSTDFFTAFLDDPYLLGQVAAQNALSDLYAAGAQPHSALAMVVVPHGSEKKQTQFLQEILSGALRVLRPVGVPLVGGHTIEGEQATIGFTVLGDIAGDVLSNQPGNKQQRTTKGGLQSGDLLVLTKPLGTGILLAGHPHALCHADWMQQLVASMLASNRDASLAARDLGIRAVTDITGFGLAGHLAEMTRAANVSAELSLAKLPVLDGAIELAAEGIESTLAPGNQQIEHQLSTTTAAQLDNRYPLLFDPQTSGGLLLGVPEATLQVLLARLGPAACEIGKVISPSAAGPTIHITL